MGFFTRKTRSKQRLQSGSGPPDICLAPSYPPALPVTTAPPATVPYANPHAAFWQPRLGGPPAGHLVPPPPGWCPTPSPGPHYRPLVVDDRHPPADATSNDNRQLRPQHADSADAVLDELLRRFDNVVTLIDCERISGDEPSLFMCQEAPPPPWSSPSPQQQSSSSAPSTADRSLGFRKGRLQNVHDARRLHMSRVAVVSSSYFSKVELYANSKLPMALPRLALYTPTWPLLRLAAQYSLRVYSPPSGPERLSHVAPDWHSGTKAMYITSVPADAARAVVLAIRGTASLADWAVNLRAAPAAPARFLDDPGNACHAGFLAVARRTVRPVAERLRQMLGEDPARAAYSLVITGHSAGGAVAALLYMHMLAVSPDAESELNVLTGCFRRVHCVTFGAPPVSLLPLTKPDRPGLRRSLFLSFVNEGDPVARADKAYLKSLLELLASPPPPPPPPSLSSSPSRLPVWSVPPSTLSNAGRIVVLRSGSPNAPLADRKTVQERLGEGVVAATCAEDRLREVIWGDPVCHLMSLYAARIEALAAAATRR